jgi:hypothetical protein
MRDRSSRSHSIPTKTPLSAVKQIVKDRWGRIGLVQTGRRVRFSIVDRACGLGAVPDQAVVSDRPGHRGTVSKVTNTVVLERGSTSMLRSSAVPLDGGHRIRWTIARVEASGGDLGPGRYTQRPLPAASGDRLPAHPSMTTLALLRSRYIPTRARKHRSVCYAGRLLGSRTVVSHSSGCCRTTAPPTRRTPNATLACELGDHTQTHATLPTPNQQQDRTFPPNLTHGWVYVRFYTSETKQHETPPGWMHFDNHHRQHSAINGTPISRPNNLSGHHT